jgi:AcrR family transcriptional regulator
MKPVRLSRAQQQAITRECLLAAAQVVISKQGYGGASVDLIAAEAGYSKGAVYSNFPNKEAIFLELLQVYMERTNRQLEQLLTVKPEQIKAALTNWLATVNEQSDCPLLVMELQLHARRNPDFAEKYYALQVKQFQTLAKLIQSFIDATGVTIPLEPLDLANTLTALANGLNLQHPATAVGGVGVAGRIIDLLLKALAKR